MSVTITSPQLTHYLTEDPQIVAKKLDRQALLWNIAEKITILALIAIGTAVLTITMVGTVAISTPIVFTIFGLALSTPALLLFGKYCSNNLSATRSAAHIEHGVAKELTQLKNKPIYDPTLPIEYKKHELLQLHARYNYWKGEFDTIYTESRKYLFDSLEDGYLKGITDRNLRYCLEEHGWNLMQQAIYARLQSAVILQLMKNPYQETELSKIGYHTPISLGQWSTEAVCNKSDDYFEFVDADRRPLNSNLITDSKIDNLRHLLFPDTEETV